MIPLNQQRLKLFFNFTAEIYTMPRSHSATEENYLKAIYKYSPEGEMVSTNTISRYLSTSPASVTDMIKRLHEKGLVEYQPYKGVSLSPEGEKIALKIIRKHRLWEVFLVKTLHFSWDQVHETAEQLEHINSPELIEKLDEFLGFPRFDPHGDPIPNKDGEIQQRETVLLSEVEVGGNYTMVGVNLHSPEFLQYLEKIGLVIGTDIEVLEKISFDQSLLLTYEGRQIIISGEIAKQLLVVSESKQ